MITNPTQQRTLRGHRPGRPTPRVANSAEHQARLAGRLTARDRWLLRMLHEHRVLTSHQIAALAFPSPRSARQRLRELWTWSVLDRFQPFLTRGTAPMHYVLGPAGATVLAAEHGLDAKKDLGYRHDRALGIAHSLRLAHTIGVNDFFTNLATHTRRHQNVRLAAWWSEARCGRHFGDLVRPDAYGRWNTDDTTVEFFLEFDLGTEQLARLGAKLTGYHALAQSSGITTPVLFWLPSSRREATARRLLHHSWRDLDNPQLLPLATATPSQLSASHSSPADAVWLPLTEHGSRRPLHQLVNAMPPRRAPQADDDQPCTTPATPGVLPPPSPLPPPNTSGGR